MTTSLYSPLSGSGSIRLIHLDRGALGDDISCTLHPSNLEEKPFYKALSYVWGDTSQTATITCNGQPFRVTSNLDAALRRLRNEERTGIFWVDAICIDQGNVSERNQQVNLMREIYAMVREQILLQAMRSATTAPIIKLTRS